MYESTCSLDPRTSYAPHPSLPMSESTVQADVGVPSPEAPTQLDQNWYKYYVRVPKYHINSTCTVLCFDEGHNFETTELGTPLEHIPSQAQKR